MTAKWTNEQQQVIDARDCSLLVSAAAGSGKTAVLVERIIQRIMDDKRPADIDRLLVVTFTNAAASEMRERIGAALEKKLEEDPDNLHLQKQTVLLHNAKITTIHSFCLDVIRNHFSEIRLDPGFRIGDDGELRLMRQEVVETLLEQQYEAGESDFLHFTDVFATGKTDRDLEKLILKLYQFSIGYPWPEQWRKECCLSYETMTEEKLEETEWMKGLQEQLQLQLQDLEAITQEAIGVCGEPDGPFVYEDALRDDLSVISTLLQCGSYRKLSVHFQQGLKFTALGRSKMPNCSEGKKALVKELRDYVKKALTKIRDDYFFADLTSIAEDMRSCYQPLAVLVRLTDAFQQAYQQRKAEKNLVDFNDLEHFALQILVRQDENGGHAPTAVAEEYGDLFQEVMTDEYQDSNLVQEMILSAVSGEEKGEHKRFMVGDVKQSIYRFRLARPELFMEKYRVYQENGVERKIDLHKNFRSRASVLETVNLIFGQIMTEAVGGVVYDENAALYPGAEFNSEVTDPVSELLLADVGAIEEDTDEEEEARSLREQEALMIVQRIRELVGNVPVWDKELESYRPARYSDMVVLLRTVSGWAEEFLEVFSREGIPAYSSTGTGYFSAIEIRTVLSYLKILDNPRQDIPLAAVLRSPIGCMTNEELARLRIADRTGDFYACCQTWLASHVLCQSDPCLTGKLQRFWKIYQEIRKMVPYTPMHLLLWTVLDRTGYGDYAGAMPGGSRRKANLDMLVEKAAAYEATSYRGLFHFVRYIEQLKKYEVDYGEAGDSGEAADTVRIMSIHKSKGLEFPIVFVGGMAKQFNQQEYREAVIVHPQLGIGCDYIDPELRVRIPMLAKKVIAKKSKEEMLGEELRILYVAMTRAKERLIMTGTVGSMEKQIKKWGREQGRTGTELSYSMISGASSFLDWVMPALLRHRSGEALCGAYDLPCSGAKQIYDQPGDTQIRIITEQICAEEQKKNLEQVGQMHRQLLELKQDQQLFDGSIRKHLEQLGQQQYPYLLPEKMPGKVSVSELKKMSAGEALLEETDYVQLFGEQEFVPIIPQFIEKQEVSGASRGTVYHHFLQELDFTSDFDDNFTDRQLECMIKCGKIPDDQANWISTEKIKHFLASETGRRMQRAAREGKLYRERPFVIGAASDTINPEWESDEQILVQGIIDVYFEEENELVLLDYKTDYVPDGCAETLVRRYHAQLDYYSLALERLTGKHVKEMLIYSFGLEQTICVPKSNLMG